MLGKKLLTGLENVHVLLIIRQEVYTYIDMYIPVVELNGPTCDN